jgi:hypothetical protein
MTSPLRLENQVPVATLNQFGVAPLSDKVLILKAFDTIMVKAGGPEARVANAHPCNRDEFIKAPVASQLHAFASQEDLS